MQIYFGEEENEKNYLPISNSSKVLNNSLQNIHFKQQQTV